jgi:hypothetical protein
VMRQNRRCDGSNHDEKWEILELAIAALVIDSLHLIYSVWRSR